MTLSNSVKKSQKVFKVVLINLVILAILLEITSLVIYLVQTGEFYYTRKAHPSAAATEVLLTKRNEDTLNPGLMQQLHPYFGFVDKPGYKIELSQTSYRANNYGFASPLSYPYKRENKDQFIIGIFGGSVAQLFSVFELQDHLLTRNLKQLPYFKNKEIVVLPFAAGSYKQPQQLLILNYFLSIGQELDMVINIDGFNEMALSYLNNKHGIDVAMPNYLVIVPLVDLANKDLSPEQLKLTLEILQDKADVKDALMRLENCKLATTYVLAWLQERRVTNKYNKDMSRLDELKNPKDNEKESLVQVNGVPSPLDDSVTLDKIAAIWANSSLMMKNVLDSRNVLYFEFLQANQYFHTERRFSDEEKIIAFSEASPYEEGVRKGYPALLSRVASLKESKVALFSAVNIFDDIKSPVYADNCCHFNNFGNEIFSNFVFKSISEALSKDPRFAPSSEQTDSSASN